MKPEDVTPELRLQLAASILGGMMTELGDYRDHIGTALKFADELIERVLSEKAGGES